MRQLKISKSITDKNQTVQEYLRDISRIPMIDDVQETELAHQARQGRGCSLCWGGEYNKVRAHA